MGAGPRLAYLHVPFCANHCLFCGFYRNKYHVERSAPYVDAVMAELESEASTNAVRGRPVHAVYFGGGTPTALEPADLARLVHAVRRTLPLAADCEFTVEGRITNFTGEKIDACLDAGANRLSIGVQSFNTGVRQKQGRRATREEAIRFVEALRARDRATVVVDLMFGLPGQTPDVWLEDLRTCLALEPDGVDLYCLNVFPGTPLFKAVAAGKSAPPAQLVEQGEMYRTGVELLARAGWHQVSNSHWARTTRERNLYNLLIKDGATTLAYGSGAGGSLGGYSYSLSDDLESYSSRTEAGAKALSGMRRSDAHQPLRDAITASIERGRIALRRVLPKAEAASLTVIEPLLDQWVAAGLATWTFDDTLDLTTAGRFWGTNLIGALSEVLIASSHPA